MAIQENFCPKCGGKTANEGLCNKCKVESIEWLICEPRVECVICPTCGSMKRGSIWTDVTYDRQQLIEELAFAAVSVHNDLEDPELAISTRDPTPNRTHCIIYVRGQLYGLPVQKTCELKIIWKKENCDRCSRLSGGYYESTIQVRATDRKPDAYERERVEKIAYDIEESVQEAGERLSFITRVDNTRDGVDIVVSSHNIGDTISRQIVTEMGGKITRHPKLVGERDGRKLYRITILLRLPQFRKGDVVFFKKRYYEVRGTDSGLLRVFDLSEGISNVLHDGEYRLIGNIRDAESADVTYIDNDIAGILDPVSYEIKDVKAQAWLRLAAHEKVRFLRDKEEDEIILVG
ncbi:60S ribosomal export protein NMD3 [Methanogenium organophilum]|uniref:60S ribosomal export protein NMD3 n=1 Tax=Methanogenium organophilum TaxID=2199 RepID=A0A9X9T7J2_METOG|nr:60S ribosomal export protein NMD3 [Methanogenium organophilum]WAI01149.1 60S ribosomal export protein NMD3 [Methanogenium organophilum]